MAGLLSTIKTLTGWEALKEGTSAIRSVAEIINKTGGDQNNVYSADDVHPKDPSEPDDPEHQPDRASSLDPSKVEIHEPYFQKAATPAVRISGDDLVRSLERLHSSIISFVEVGQKNTMAGLEYAQARLKSQDASILRIEQRSDRLEKFYASLDERYKRFDRELSSLKDDTKKKPEVPTTENKEDNRDATKKDGGSLLPLLGLGMFGGTALEILSGIAVVAAAADLAQGENSKIWKVTRDQLLPWFEDTGWPLLQEKVLPFLDSKVDVAIKTVEGQIWPEVKTLAAAGAQYWWEHDTDVIAFKRLAHKIEDIIEHPFSSLGSGAKSLLLPHDVRREATGAPQSITRGSWGNVGGRPIWRPESGPDQQAPAKELPKGGTAEGTAPAAPTHLWDEFKKAITPAPLERWLHPATPAGKPQGVIGPVIPEMLSKMFGGRTAPTTRHTTPDILAPTAQTAIQTTPPTPAFSTYGPPPEGATGTDLIALMQSITGMGEAEGYPEGGRGTGSQPGGPTFRRGIGPGAYSPQGNIPRGTAGGYEGPAGRTAFKGDPSELKAGSERFFIQQGNIQGVDASLVHLIKEASKDLPPGYRVEMISGHDSRSTGTTNHPGGIAMDVRIYDDKGKAIPHTGFGAGFKDYEKLYQSVEERGKVLYPDNKYIWGGTWISSAAGYGDRMHYQRLAPWVRGSSQSMAGYDPETGARGQFRQSGMSSEELEQYKKSIHEKALTDYKDAAAQKIPQTDATKVPGPQSSLSDAEIQKLQASPGAKAYAQITKEGVVGTTSISEIESNPQAQAAIARFEKAFPNVPNARMQIYSLIRGESDFSSGGRSVTGQYSGYFQLGGDEAYKRLGLTKEQFASLPFHEQMDAYTRWALQNDPSGERMKNLGLFNAASSMANQEKGDDQVIYRAGSKEALRNPGWVRNSYAGGAVTVGGIKAYYGRNDPRTIAELTKAREGYAPEEAYGSLLTKLTPAERQAFPSTDWQAATRTGQGEDITARFAMKQAELIAPTPPEAVRHTVPDILAPTVAEAVPIPRERPEIAAEAVPIPRERPEIAAEAVPIPRERPEIAAEAVPIPRERPTEAVPTPTPRPIIAGESEAGAKAELEKQGLDLSKMGTIKKPPTGITEATPSPAEQVQRRFPRDAEMKTVTPPEKSLYPAGTAEKERGAAAAKAGGFGDYSKPTTPPGGWGSMPDHTKPGMYTGRKPVAPTIPYTGGSHPGPAGKWGHDFRDADRGSRPPNPQHHPDQLPASPGNAGGGQRRDPDNIGICSV